MSKTHYYIISGLGADHKAFQKIHLPENHTHLAWIENKPHESLKAYARRMAEKIQHENPILIGLSFGGIVAQEIAEIVQIQSLILISTIKNHYEKPFYFRLASTLKILKFLPKRLFKNANTITYWLFSLNTQEEKALLDYFYPITNPGHLIWAVNEILNWKGCDFDCDFVHIHSSGDRLFPIKNISNGIAVSGGHFAVYTNADEMNSVLAGELYS